MTERTSLPEYDDGALKQELKHVEYGSGTHLDIHDAASPGHVATDAHGHALVSIDKVASSRLARKIDLHIVPIVALQYLFAFIDRANIGNARLAGLEKDLKLTGYDYNTLLSIFYVSYIVFEIPANLFTKWLGPGKAIPLYTVIFGVLSIACGFVNTFGAALAVRFLLGVAEAGMLPGIAYYLSRWYTKDELAFRLALYIVCAPLAGAFGGLLASGILTIDGIGKVHTWQQIFLIEGIITTAIGIGAYFLMTDRPEVARWLSQEEKDLASTRIKAEHAGSTTVLDKMNTRAIKQGILAPTTLVIGLIFLLNNITVQGVAFFTPTIVRTIYPNKSTVQQQLFTVPPYIVGGFFTVLFPYISMKIKRRGIIMLCSAPLMTIGYIIFLATENAKARYGAIFLIMAGAFSFGALCNAWAAMNVASDTARAAALGYVVMLGNCGGLISTWSFLPSDGPNYPIGNGLNAATSACIFLLAGFLLWFIRVNNKKREAGQYDHYLNGVTAEEAHKLGNNHPGFRYKP
ncbi:hypothetical protein NliqN6_5472 [Naganishia liquefaciens]|uniref:Major facilitator superfamily (MFS) profile domain-containing protein n=1 Tax=Naganishia liquefaciens TaxID=104408 RepID=A0A8H3TYA5_9TREE|nr:hypothetical protein NliqN6_5472 [Naganishia liquefaciens]